MKNEFVLAFNEVLEEKGLPKEVVLEALQAALASAYRRHVNASNAQQVDAVVDPETGNVKIYAEKEVVEVVEDDRTEVSLEAALEVEEDSTLGSMVIVETTPKNFGRVAAQTARQVIQQRIREAERDAQFDYYSKQVGEILNGIVQAVNSQAVTLGLEMKAEGIMPRSHQIPRERFRVHDRVRALLLEVKTTPRGPQIILSRAHRNFLRRLLENEVPEIYQGLVEIRSIAREPGQRSKVAVAALQPGVDPVGACVGIRGVRIQAIVRELNDEKIDVIEWSTDPAVYIAKSLSPARVSGVYLNEAAHDTKTATVVVPEDQLSLAIGRDGQNARLAAKLTSWRIDIKSLPEAAADALDKLTTGPEYASMAEAEADVRPQVEAVLAKKAEGRPVTPEEYQVITQFVDRIERGLMRKQEEERKAEEERQRVARANVPEMAFEVPLDEFEISDRVYAVVSETGVQSVGDLMVMIALDPDSVWRLSGMGPKAMAELEAALEKLRQEAEAAEEAKKALELEAEQDVLEAAAEVEVGVVEAAESEAAIDEGVELLELEEEVAEEEEITTVEESEEIEDIAEEVEELETVSELEIEETPEEEIELEAMFTLEGIGIEQVDDEMFEDEDQTEQKRKKRKKYVEIEYDPDQDVLVTKKKRKRGGTDWEEEW